MGYHIIINSQKGHNRGHTSKRVEHNESGGETKRDGEEECLIMKRGKNRRMNAVGIVTVWMTKAICEWYE
jgi:hypothetical protein